MRFSITNRERPRPHISMPVRTCVGCRKTDEQCALLRGKADLVGHLRFDDGPARVGRGVYVHRRKTCMDAAIRSGFARSLRRMVQIDDVAALHLLAATLSQPGVAPVGITKNQDNHP